MVDLKKFLPGHDEKSTTEYFWALVIEPGWIQAGIWKIQESQAEISFVSAPVAWELESELINACDSALSSAVQDFPEETKEPSKTVFAVPASWVLGGEIKPEYLDKIKTLCSELSLTPVGFVVLPEAIAHLVKSQEGSPLTAVVLGVYRQNLEVSVFRLGKLAGNTQVARSISLVDDLVEGLSRFATGESVPSRFLLYDGREGELEEARQELLKANWQDFGKLNFLHTPKVELIEARSKVSACALGGASELANISSLASTPEVAETKKEEGFSWPESQEKTISPEELGFVEEKDVRAQRKVDLPLAQQESIDNLEAIGEEAVSPEVSPFEGSKPPRFGKFKKGFSGISIFMKSILSRFSFGNFGKMPFLYGAVFLILLAILGLAAWWFYPKAEVTVYVSPKRLEEKIEVTFDPAVSQSDLPAKVLAANSIQNSVSGERTKDTSGTKTVGEKAKGEVTIYRVGPEITLTAGTALNGPGGLKFVIDDRVNIASGSAGTAGSTKTSVTAEDIGAQYNLASGTTFSVGNYSTSDLEAKNESSFSGGTSREVSAVSSDDQQILLGELSDELKNNALSDLQNEVDQDKYLIEESLEATSSARNFSHKVDEETQSLKLSLTLDTSALTVQREELINLVQESLKDKVPQGFVLRGEQLTFSFEKDSQEDSLLKYSVRVSANLLPEVNAEDIIKSIKGRHPKVAEEFLTKEVPGFVRAEIKIKPTLPGRLKTLPHVSDNIEVGVAAER